MHYPHDGGFFAKLPDGSVMLGGGVAESFGIGQSLGVEVFSPSDDSFNPLGILSSRRALCSALALPDGSVLVSGNWCAQDDMALYLPGRGFKAGKPVTEQRSVPFILPTADGDVLVFGSQWVNGETSGGRWVDCLKGEPFRPALFEEYFPRSTFITSAENCALGGGAFLIPLTRRADGQLAFAHLQGTEFTLLETDHPVPMTLPDGSEVRWDLLQVDRTVRKAYSVGLTSGAGLAVLVLDYDPVLDGGVAGVSLRFAPEEEGPFPYESHPVLLRSGQIVLAGGRMEDNFHPVSSVFLLHVNGKEEVSRAASLPWWLWVLLALLVAGGVFALVRGRKKAPSLEAESPRQDLLSRIVALMEEEHFYLRKELRVADVAAALGTNATYISACLNGQRGQSFTDFVAQYRVHHAKELLSRNPKLSLAQVADESGFPSERSFYRCFKALTGKTPSEWRSAL